MKQLIFSTFTAANIFLITGCEKNSSNSKEYDNTLPGIWKEFQYFISPGAGGEWKAGNGLVVNINSDFTYTSNKENSFWGKTGKIENITDSSFTVNPPFFNGPAIVRYTVKDGVFEVWYICIEGCASRFKKETN